MKTLSKNQLPCNYTVSDIFRIFLMKLDENESDAISYLNECMNVILKFQGKFEIKDNKSIWFKFFSDDTGATDTNDIINSLKLPKSHQNHKYMLDCINTAINNPKELQVYYS